MARAQTRSKRKPSGGRYHFFRTKRKYELSGYPANTKLDKERQVRNDRVRAGQIKQVILSVNQISVSDPQGKSTKTEIFNVIENPANPNLVRRNIITKGCVVETPLGKVRVTSRPGQEGSLSGVMVK